MAGGHDHALLFLATQVYFQSVTLSGVSAFSAVK